MFKISIFGSLLFMTLVAAVPVNAQSIEDNNSVNNSYSLTPRELISLGRHGIFKAQGIPSQSNFGHGVRSGKITAEALVQSAIANNRLPKNASGDRNYLEAVTNHLKSGGCGSI
ncbi:MAG: hypothetical protein QNJ53_31065 [Pleurocapsa sp. MO_192.B19]|nr:hypothetical protein [Pleurocapsa sp. MO_192.B19]